jgi:PKD repeat protein
VAFYTASSYPIKYKNACFFQDYGQSWLRVAFINDQNQLVSIESFGSAMESPVDLQTEPGTGDLVYVSISAGEVRRIHYTLANTPPAVVATATPSAGPIPLDVQFSSNGTTDPNGDPLTLTWSFGDGTPNSTLANPLHTYATIGTFTATLTASDGRGGVSSKSLTIETRNTPPTATITNPVDGYRFTSGEFVTLQATATDHEDGTNLAYFWEVRVIHNNHIHPENFVSNSQTPPPVELEGHGTSGDRYSYQVILTVTDSGGLTATDSVVLVPVEITVNGPPVARFTTTPPSGNAPLLVNFDASSSSDPDGDLILNYTWDFGDGSTGTGSVISHIYEVQGNYTARLTTEDMLHASSTAQAIIPVQTSGLKGEYFD